VENEFTNFPRLLLRDINKGNIEEIKRINKRVLWLISQLKLVNGFVRRGNIEFKEKDRMFL
jgi:hypothetical protein